MLPIFLEDPSRFSVVLSRRCLAPMDPCSLIGFFWASWSQSSLNGSMEMLKRFWLQLIVVPRFVTTSRDSLMCSSFSKDSLGFFGIGWDSFRIGGRLKWIGFFLKKKILFIICQPLKNSMSIFAYFRIVCDSWRILYWWLGACFRFSGWLAPARRIPAGLVSDSLKVPSTSGGILERFAWELPN